MMNTKIWTTRDGSKIAIKDMSDSHLLNTIRFLDRAHDAQILQGAGVAASMNGDMAQYAVQQEIDGMINAGPASSYPIYRDMVEEAEDRGLIK